MTLFWILDGLSTWLYLLAAVYETKSKQHPFLTCNGYLIDLTSVFSIGRTVEFLASVLTMVEPTASLITPPYKSQRPQESRSAYHFHMEIDSCLSGLTFG